MTAIDLGTPPNAMQQSWVDRLAQTFIIAYKEPTENLVSALEQVGCDCTVLRQVHQPGYETYSASYLCLLNHRRAWELALRSDKPTLIVEADFVPVKNFAQLPIPFDPDDDNMGISWLYTCASQVYSVSGPISLNPLQSSPAQGTWAQGYSTAMVAYIITAKSARALIDLAKQIDQDPGPHQYSAWDSGIEYFLRDRSFHNYVPFRNYGEHGGKPNPEHGQNALSKAHRADVLYGPLTMPPLYAEIDGKISRWQWAKVRAYARIKGIGRLLLRKYLRPKTYQGSHHKGNLLRWSIARYLTW